MKTMKAHHELVKEITKMIDHILENQDDYQGLTEDDVKQFIILKRNIMNDRYGTMELQKFYNKITN